MDTPITRAEHEEFRRSMEAENRRQDEENHRQNRRIDLLEQNVEKMGALTTSVEKLATNMESMLREQEQQGKQLRELEAKDGEMWRKVAGYIITAVVGIVIGFIFENKNFENKNFKIFLKKYLHFFSECYIILLVFRK